MTLPTDTQLLDWLQAQLDERRYTGRCVFRLSEHGRGWRLHETSYDGAVVSVREAIARAMWTPDPDEPEAVAAVRDAAESETFSGEFEASAEVWTESPEPEFDAADVTWPEIGHKGCGCILYGGWVVDADSNHLANIIPPPPSWWRLPARLRWCVRHWCWAPRKRITFETDGTLRIHDDG